MNSEAAKVMFSQAYYKERQQKLVATIWKVPYFCWRALSMDYGFIYA